MGAHTLNPDDDFTDYALPLAQRVATTKGSFGMLLCRNGVGVAIVANKVRGIRAMTSFDPNHAKSGRRDDNANVLCLPADYRTLKEIKKIITVWLSTPFSNEKRYRKRLQKIQEYEHKRLA